MNSSVYLVSGLVGLLAIVGVWVWIGFAFSALFRKIGEETWQAWVPILPFAVLLRRAGHNPWLVLVPVLNAVLIVISMHHLNRQFGYGIGMTILGYFVPVVWASILGFGSARWLGADGAARPVVNDQFGSYAPAPSAASGSRPPAAAASSAAVDAWSFAPPPSTAPEPASAAPSLRSTADPTNTVTSSNEPMAPPSWAPSPAGAGYSFPPSAAEVAPPPAIADVAPPPPLPDFPQVPPPRPLTAAPDMPGIPPAGPVFSAPPVPPVPPAPAVPSPPAVSSVPAVPAPPAGLPNAAFASVPPPLPPRPSVVPPAETDAPFIEPTAAATDVWTPPTRRRAHDDAFSALDSSAEVSAVAGAPQAGAPRSALTSVSAQHKLPEIPETVPDIVDAPVSAPPLFEAPVSINPDDQEPNDETVIVARRRSPKFVITPPAGPPIPVTADVVIVGRRPSADPAFPEAQLVSIVDETRTVSKTHARLELTDRGWVLTDLGSTNGVVLFEADGSELEVQADGIGRVLDRFLLGDAELRLTGGVA